ncbi:EAL domain-containing protein [Symbioplanes lichenis]|uniref:EAL domain-containing protein n=1 Tax=Symbioplanes lichenis TaxID=1629072 RepID=UPI002738A149|nr:EAL domain-containing protein [Actinoplanes lichenis]
MNLEDIIELAAARQPTVLDRARTRRAAERVQSAHAVEAAAGRNPAGDLDPSDPLGPGADEITGIKRGAEAAKAGWIHWDAGTGALTWSDEMSRIFGYPAVASRIGQDVLAGGLHPRDAGSVSAEVRLAWREMRPAELTCRVVRPDATVRHLRCLVEVLTLDGYHPAGIIVTAHDMTDAERERQDRARHRLRARLAATLADQVDRLSDRPAPAAFADEIDALCRTESGALLVIAVELPHSLSADQTNQVTRTVAELVQQALPAGHRSGVVGPAQFGIVAANEVLAAALSADLHRSLSSAMVCGVRLRSWHGIVPYAPDYRVRGEDLVIDAAYAWRESRRKKTTLTVLPAPLANGRESMMREYIQSTVRSGQLSLYAQPILDLELGVVTRHEILLRIARPGTVADAPAAFLATARRGAESVNIDKWVMDQALGHIGEGPQTSHYQINVSGRTISTPGVVSFVLDTLHRHQVDPTAVTFEITESEPVDNLTVASDFAARVTAAGCGLALDDFGTGHSSLVLLKQLPIDLVKIDGQFITDLATSGFDRIAVRSTVEMCRQLGIRTVAEYVEESSSFALLRELGVDFAQGHAVGRAEAIIPSAPGRAPTRAAELDRAIG